MFGKHSILRCMASALVVAFAVGEVGAVSTAPINPAFLRWKKRDNKLSLPIKPNVNRPKLMAASNEEPVEERPLGQMPDLFDSSYLSRLNFNVNRGVADALPSSYDLRNGRLTHIRDQGDYGTCWAHASYSSLESWLLINKGLSFDFSENNLANLHGFDWGFDDGGNASLSQAYFLRWCGPVLESQDPYPNPGGSVEMSPSRHVQRVRWIPGRTMYLDNDAIKAAVQKYGALHVNYYHIFDATCYNSRKAAYYLYVDNPQRLTNHAVALVGWDDNYPKSNFSVTPPGNGAFIVRNNWGMDWGEAGYFYVSYYDESFAWSQLYAFTDAEPSDNYDGIYQYDPLGLISSIGYSSTTAWGASLFTSTDGLPVAAVGFYALVPSTSYTIRIYVGCSAGNPSSGTLAHEQTGKTDELGYWTIPLSKSVSVNKGQRFAVVLKLTTPGYNYPLAFEYAYAGFSSAASANAGETFLSSNGSAWSDFTDVNGTASFCCKAYTKRTAAPAKTLSSLAITGANSLQSGKSAQFSCKARYSDGSEKDVTNLASWSIASGSAYASVSSSGLVLANGVAEQQTVRVHAEYTDGTTKSDDWSFYVTVAAPAAPANLSASQGTDSSCVRVTWSEPLAASSYAVYRGMTTSSGNATFVQNVTVPKFNDVDAEPGVKYTYFVKAKNDSGTSGFSAGAQGWRALSAPANVTASDGASLEYVEVTWTAAAGAKYYRVYRSEEIDGEKTELGSWQSATSYRDATATPGKVYCYTVKSAIDSRGNMASSDSIFDEGSIGVPVTLDSLSIDGAAMIPSGGNATYTCTATYTDHSTRAVGRPSWTIRTGGDYASVDSSGKVTAKTVTENRAVTLQASYTDGVNRTATKTITITVVVPSAPSSVALTSATSESVTISWSSVSGASGYSVWRGSSTVDAKKIAEVGDRTEYADRNGTPGVSYTYWVKASNAAGESDFSAMSVTAMLELAAPEGVAASDGAYSEKTVVTWKPVAGATHYRVVRAGSAIGTKTEISGWQTGTSYEDKSGAAGTRYWYFVEAATSDGGANASAYSAGDEGWRKVAVTLSSIAITGPSKLAAGRSTVLSCTATYSDGSTKAVRPEWSVSPATAATIDADGKLKAASVTENATVVVTASFADPATKTATCSVSIEAPIIVTAEVKNVQPKARWPFSNLLDVDYELVTQPAGARAFVMLSGYDGDKGVALAARSVTGDGVDAPVESGKHRLSWDVAADYPDLHTTALSVEMSAVSVSANVPTNVTASAGTSTEGVDIAWASVDEATGYEVWRNTSSKTNGAERIQTTEQVAYTDTGATAGTTYYYWVRSVTEEGVSDFGSPVSGWRAYADIIVTFDGNGGLVTQPGAPARVGISYSPTKSYHFIPTATRQGYAFDGWYTSSSGGTKVTASSIVPTENTTLWAHWTAHTYTIRFDANGGSGSMDDLEMTYGVEKNLTVNAFSKSGNTFKGWATSADGPAMYVDGSLVKNLTAGNGVTVTLFAVWELPVVSLAEAVDNAALTITTGGDANWTVDNTTVYTGGASAKSGEIGDNQSSWMQTTITGPGTFSFRWKASSEEAYDTLAWTLDGVAQGEISGESDWELVTAVLSEGDHVIRWTYTKDESGGEGGDCGWVDAVVTPFAVPTGVSAGDGTVTASVKVSWTVVSGATGYTIWRGETEEVALAEQLATVATTSFTDKTGTPGKLYYYWVTATDGVRTSAFGTPDTGYRALAAPTNVAASDNTLALGVSVTWDAVDGADGYAVYRGTSTTGDTATKIAETKVPCFLDLEVAAGAKSYYFVKATHASGVTSAFSAYDKGSRKTGNPRYVVVDLSGGTTAANYPISELDDVPSGGWSDEYKTNKLVLRRIANGSFMMGSPAGELGRRENEVLHRVTISRPFYMGAFEVTQKQYELVMGENPSHYKGDARPVESLSYDMIRGSQEGARWPSGNSVDSACFLGKIRERTGLTFDLPTEAQWEYACRAGTTTALNIGKNLVSSSHDPTMDEIGRYYYNEGSSGSFSTPDGKGGYSIGHTTVGSYCPNAWGLYDMHGNVIEWCLDWYAPDFDSSMVESPVGPENGDTRVWRGGYWRDWALYCRSSCRASARPSFDGANPSQGGYTGFRLCCPAGQATDQVAVSFDSNGGEGSMLSVSVGNGGSMVVPECVFYKRGYVFAGWATSSSGSVVYEAGATIPSVTSALVLFAKWAAPSKTYLVVDLSGGTSAETFPLSELDDVPSGGWTDEYKTTKLVLRRIANGSFTMGGRKTDHPSAQDYSLHSVTISKPFYMGVFEFTQKQYELVMGSNPSSNTGDARPVVYVSYKTLRGSKAGGMLPTADTVEGFMGVIRYRTGLDFDLPTEAQWEYACRAGTTTALNSGKNLNSQYQDSAMDEVGRYGYNSRDGLFQGGKADGKGGYQDYTKVGSYAPNAWGLYDMHGNVAEWCLDFFASQLGTSPVTDPEGAESGVERVLRGGSWNLTASSCCSASRDAEYPTESDTTKGFRICCPGGLPTDQVTVSFDANGGSGTMASVTTGKGGSFAIPKVTFTRTGYTFQGWATSTSGNVVYAGGDTIPSVSNDIVLYVHWKKVVDLLPLRSLLSSIDFIKNRDGTISDKEMSYALSNPSLADMDGDTSNISSEEKEILQAIATFYNDTTLLSNLFNGNYSAIDEVMLNELEQLSNRIKRISE